MWGGGLEGHPRAQDEKRGFKKKKNTHIIRARSRVGGCSGGAWGGIKTQNGRRLVGVSDGEGESLW